MRVVPFALETPKGCEVNLATISVSGSGSLANSSKQKIEIGINDVIVLSNILSGRESKSSSCHRNQFTQYTLIPSKGYTLTNPFRIQASHVSLSWP